MPIAAAINGFQTLFNSGSTPPDPVATEAANSTTFRQSLQAESTAQAPATSPSQTHAQPPESSSPASVSSAPPSSNSPVQPAPPTRPLPHLLAFSEAQRKPPGPQQPQPTATPQAVSSSAKSKANPAKPSTEASTAPPTSPPTAPVPIPPAAPETANVPAAPAASVARMEGKDWAANPSPSLKVAGNQPGASAKHAAAASAAGKTIDSKPQAADASPDSVSQQVAANADGAGSAPLAGMGGGRAQGGSDAFHPSFEKAMTAELPAASAMMRENAGTPSAPLPKGEAVFNAMQPTGAAHALGGDAPQTLVATQNVLEVGITGGAHGWLRVRAELGQTGEVTASLVASNAGAADMLHKQLGAISAFLKSESVGVSSLAVTAPEKSGASASATYGNAASAGGGTNPGSQGRGGQDAARPFPGLSSGETGSDGDRVAGWPMNLAPTMLAGQGSLGSLTGGWLNVMA